MVVAGSVGVVDRVGVLVGRLVIGVEFAVERGQLEGQDDAREQQDDAAPDTEPDPVERIQHLSDGNKDEFVCGLPQMFSPFSHFLNISLCRAGHYVSHPVILSRTRV